MNPTLLLVDIQNDYFPHGAMELVGSRNAGAQAGKLLDAFRQHGLPVIHVQHVSTRPGATFFRPDTEGVRTHECVAPIEAEVVFRKHYPNSFRETPLLARLREREVTQLVIAGMMTHMCIDTTTRAASDFGFACTLAHDACATKALTFAGRIASAEDIQTAYLAALDGAFAHVRTVEEICNDLVPAHPPSAA